MTGAAVLLEGRAAVVADLSLRGRALCRALSDMTDTWLAALLREAADDDLRGLALVATGGYGRQELAPESDLDVWLLHQGRDDVGLVAERLWYPVWDAGLKLGHAVRTPRQAMALAAEDLDTATATLSARHIAGDEALAAEFIAAATDRWRKKGFRWLDDLHLRVRARHALAGEVAFLLEPDLKDGRGGLRDIHALRWAEAARPVMLPGDAEALAAAEDVLLDVRVALHRATRRHNDDLLLERQDEVAAALGDADADALMARVAAAGRTVAWVSDEAWRREMASTTRGGFGRSNRRERPVAPGLLLRGGEVCVEPDADLDDRGFLLRTAATAATNGLPIQRASLELLAERSPALDGPWPDGARQSLVDLLWTGQPAIHVLETLDQRRLLERVLPEWEPVRSRPQRNALHRFTVDRHLCEAAANAAELTTTVSRPDLLLVGTWLHDIGKGYPGDHTEVGMELVAEIGARMGFPPEDVAVLVDMVRLHLLLPDVATRRDLADQDVIQGVADTVGSLLTLELLAALTEADSRATGHSAWGPWKAELVDELVRRVAHVLRGGEPGELPSDEFPGPDIKDLMAQGRTTVQVEGHQLTVVAPDRPGLFSRVAGTLALKGLTVLAAEAGGDGGMAASQFRLEAREVEVDWEEVVADVRRAVDGRIAVEARLAQRQRTGRRMPSAMRLVGEPTVRVDNTASGTSTVVEVRAPDRLGVLYRITRAFGDLDLDIDSAKIVTLGHEVVDSFYVRTTGGAKVEARDHIRELERAILHQLSL